MKTAKLTLFVLLFAFSTAKADIVLVPDFRVDQDPTPNAIRSVASSINYGYFVVYYRFANPPTFKGRGYARRFDLNGNPLGNAFRVDGAPDNIEAGGQSVIIDTNGNMVFAWSDNRTGQYHVYFRKFDINETPLNVDTVVDQGTGANGGYLTSLPGGGFVIGFGDFAGPGGTTSARIYNSSSIPIGNTIRVDQNPDVDSAYGITSGPLTAVSPTGRIFFAWDDARNRTIPPGNIYARIFDFQEIRSATISR